MRTTDANADLMAPIAAILNASPKDLPTKVGVLVDLAAALLARDGRFRNKRELRLTADEMRDRLIKVTQATHEWIDQRLATASADRGAFPHGARKEDGATTTPAPPPHVLARPAGGLDAGGDEPPLPTVQPHPRTDH